MGNSYSDGVLITLRLRIKQDAPDGKTNINITASPNLIFNDSWNNVPHQLVPGEVTVTSVVHGDVNGDGSIDSRDVLLLRQHINGWPVDIDVANADANGDGSIDSRDVLLVRQYVNGWDVTLGSAPVPAPASSGFMPFSSAFSPFAAASSANMTFTVESVTANSGEYIEVPIMVTGNPGIMSATVNIAFDGDALEWDLRNGAYNPAAGSRNTWPFLAGSVLTMPVAPSGASFTPTSARFVFEDAGMANSYGDGVLITLRLRVKEGVNEGNTSISITTLPHLVFNEDWENVSHSTVNSVVTINSTPPLLSTTYREAFPDANFRSFVLANVIGNGRTADCAVSDADKAVMAARTSLNVSQRNIVSLTGIKYFTGLTFLDCSINRLTELDVRKNTALTTLICRDNRLRELDVSQNTALTQLQCHNNQLTELDVSKNTLLRTLDCHNNQLTKLDVSNNTSLTFLSCGNNLLKELDVSKNTALTSLQCRANQLTVLDVRNNTLLLTLDCQNNLLTELDVSQNTSLVDLYCNGNRLTMLDVSRNRRLQDFRCDNNHLTALNLTGIPVLIFQGSNQTHSITMTWSNTAQRFESLPITLNNPSNLATGLTYIDGKLISTTEMASSPFTVQTGSSGRTLSGTLNLTYDKPDSSQEHAITVMGGIGGGNFAAGATVTITANTPPNGQQFSHWTASPYVTFANANNASTTFSMPMGAVVVTAHFEPIPHVCSNKCECPDCDCECINKVCHDCGDCADGVVCIDGCLVCDNCPADGKDRCTCADDCADCQACGDCDCTNKTCHDCGTCAICTNDHITVITDTLTELLKDTSPDIVISLTVENEILCGIPSRITTSALAGLTGVAEIKNSDNSQRDEDAYIGTGTIIVFEDGTELVVVVFGDTTGNGEVDMFDVANVLAHIRDEITLTGAIFEAANVLGGEDIDIFDVASILAYIRGEIQIFRE
jgi:hypothetical protein